MSQERLSYPPLVAHGPDNQGAIVVVISYSFMFTTILFGCMRIWTSYMQERDLRWDCLAFCLAVLLIIPESILTERAVGQGLGQHISAVPASKLVSYYKYIYQSHLLGIVIQCLSKAAVVILIERIAAEPVTQKHSFIIKIAIATWSLFSLLTIAFQCDIGQPWVFTRKNCAAGGRLYYVVVIGNIATDFILALYFVPVIWRLQMSRSLRLLISSMFSLRLIVCAISVAYLALLPKYLSSDDNTWYNTNPQILHQAIVNASVIVTGMLGTRRFLSELHTGRLALVLSDREIEMTTTSANSKKNSKAEMSSNDNSHQPLSQTSGRFTCGKWKDIQNCQTGEFWNADSSAHGLPLRPDQLPQFTAYVTGGGGSRGHGKRRTCAVVAGETTSDDEVTPDDQSTISLKKNGVYQRRDFEIHVEYDCHSVDGATGLRHASTPQSPQ